MSKHKLSNKLPCKDCVTLAICKSVYDSNRRKTYHDTIYIDIDALFRDKCSLMKTYLDGKGVTTIKAKKKKIRIWIDYFEGYSK